MIPKVLLIGYVWPELSSSAAGLRDWNLVKSIREANWELVYASGSQPNAHSQLLNNAGIRTIQVRANDPDFDSMLLSEMPDFVIFDRFVTEEQFGWRVR